MSIPKETAAAALEETVDEKMLVEALSTRLIFKYKSSYITSLDGDSIKTELCQQALKQNRNLHTLNVVWQDTTSLKKIFEIILLDESQFSNLPLNTLIFNRCEFIKFPDEAGDIADVPIAAAEAAIALPHLQKIIVEKKISKFHLINCKIEDEQLAILIKTLSKKHIKELNLQDTKLGPESCNALIDFLTDNVVIQTLKISNREEKFKPSNINKDLQTALMVSKLMETTEQNKKPTLCELEIGAIGPETAQKIQKLFSNNTTLTSVSLTFATDIPSSFLSTILKTLTNNKKTQISHLTIDAIHNRHLQITSLNTEIKNLLKQNTVLETFSMETDSEIAFSTQAIADFYLAIKENAHSKIKSFRVREEFSSSISQRIEPGRTESKKLDALCQLVGSNKTINTLDWALQGSINNSASFRIQQPFPKLLTVLDSAAHNITHLSFTEYDIEDSMLNLLATSLTQPKCKIAVLDVVAPPPFFFDNHFKPTTKGWNTFLNSLETNTSLTSLDISNVTIPESKDEQETTDIFHHLLKNPNLQLTALNLTGYKIFHRNQNNKLLAWVSTNRTLKHLKLAKSNYEASLENTDLLLDHIQGNPQLQLIELEIGRRTEKLQSVINLLNAKRCLIKFTIEDDRNTTRGLIATTFIIRNRANAERVNYFWSFLAPLIAFYRANAKASHRDSIHTLLQASEKDRPSIAEFADLVPLQGLNKKKMQNALTFQYFAQHTGVIIPKTIPKAPEASMATAASAPSIATTSTTAAYAVASSAASPTTTASPAVAAAAATSTRSSGATFTTLAAASFASITAAISSAVPTTSAVLLNPVSSEEYESVAYMLPSFDFANAFSTLGIPVEKFSNTDTKTSINNIPNKNMSATSGQHNKH